ncbi:hypothetical protein QBC36DRAFT_140416, partial [Triangularia setosa]
MSDKDRIAQLLRELEEAKAREEEAKAREEEAKAREEEARAREEEAKAREAQERCEKEEAKAREAQERCEKEEAKAREAQERCEKERLQLEHRKTTFPEYLRNCHRHLYNALRLADTSQSSTGYTKVVGKYYPKRLRPWTNFANVLHPRYFDLVQKICGQRQLFESASTTKGLG